ncbi:MAG: hypothetical protein HN608_12240, partial [Rhodospirillaceae bacterium]|nr:hypothetical protein [Rhodospirillaceae bacterium]
MQHIPRAILSFALALGLAAPALAKTETIKGTSCWTGKLDMIATTKKDMGWTYKLDFTWLAEGNDKDKSLSGRCVGSGGMVGGKYQSSPFFCTINAADGSSYMSRGMGSPKGAKSTLFGGTGAFAGVTGTVTGGPAVKMHAPKGSFAR